MRAAEQPVAVPRARAPRATGALLGGRLADPSNGEPGEAGGRGAAPAAARGVVSKDPSLLSPGVDDVTHARDRQRRLRDVRRDDHEPVTGRGRVEHASLPVRGQHRVQREDVHRTGAVVFFRWVFSVSVVVSVSAAARLDGGGVRADPLVLRLGRLLGSHPFAAVHHDVLFVLAYVARAVVVVGHLVEIILALKVLKVPLVLVDAQVLAPGVQRVDIVRVELAFLGFLVVGFFVVGFRRIPGAELAFAQFAHQAVNLPLAGEEDQYAPRRELAVYREHLLLRGAQVIQVLGPSREVDRDGELTRRHLQQRRRRGTEPLVPDEFLHPQRRRHHHQTKRRYPGTLPREFRPQRNDPGQEAEQYVRVDAAFVRLVDDDDAVLAQEQVALNLAEQDAVRHELDPRFFSHLLVVSHLVPHVAAEGNVELLRHPRRRGRDRHAPRLRHGDGAGMRRAHRIPVPRLVQKLGHLRRLTAPRLAADDRHRVVVYVVYDVVLRTENRQTLSRRLYALGASHLHRVRRADEDARKLLRRRRPRRLVRRRQLCRRRNSRRRRRTGRSSTTRIYRASRARRWASIPRASTRLPRGLPPPAAQLSSSPSRPAPPLPSPSPRPPPRARARAGSSTRGFAGPRTRPPPA
mmetsp:Transcript_13671/g.61385  ORF Transcript_13671/g.61385 Transcript_13671/m.61385 type:complete len:633 (-) Transcript_13671:428-2326(-)